MHSATKYKPGSYGIQIPFTISVLYAGRIPAQRQPEPSITRFSAAVMSVKLIGRLQRQHQQKNDCIRVEAEKRGIKPEEVLESYVRVSRGLMIALWASLWCRYLRHTPV